MKFATKSGEKSVKESDHNTLFLHLEIPQKLEEKEKDKRQTIFNFNDKEAFQRFFYKTNENKQLQNCFRNEEESLEIQKNDGSRSLKISCISLFKK